MWFASILSSSVSCLFTFLMLQKIFILMKSSVSSFSFIACALGVILKNPLPNPRSWILNLMFHPKSFMVLALMFRSLTHFELKFVYGQRQKFKFTLLYVNKKLSKHHLLKRLFFPHWMALPHWLKIKWS